MANLGVNVHISNRYLLPNQLTVFWGNVHNYKGKSPVVLNACFERNGHCGKFKWLLHGGDGCQSINVSIIISQN